VIQVHGKATKEELDNQNVELFKINIRYEEKTKNGEGIWARACTAEDAEIHSSAKAGLEFYVFLLNDPICPDVLYGDKIKCITAGANTRHVSAEVSSSRKEYDRVREELATKVKDRP
jgi:hypothetical protein